MNFVLYVQQWKINVVNTQKYTPKPTELYT